MTVAPTLGAVSRQAAEIAVGDFGPVHGRDVDLGDPVDTSCSPDGGRAGASGIVGDPQVVGIIGTNCSAAAVAASSDFAALARACDGLEGTTLISAAALLVSAFLEMPQSEGIYFAGPESDFGSNVNERTGRSGQHGAVMPPAERSVNRQNPGRKSSNYLQDCTICVSCGLTGPCWTVP